jgi:hypothetical protein
MSVTSLPPVWETWTDEDLDNLTLYELEKLHAVLRNKMFVIEDRFDQETIFYPRNRAKIRAREKRMGRYDMI